MCIGAQETQNLLKVNKIDFFRNSEWLEASPDLNACKHLRVILMATVEQHLQNTREELFTFLTNFFKEMEFNCDLSVSHGVPPQAFGGSSVGGRWSQLILKQSRLILKQGFETVNM